MKKVIDNKPKERSAACRICGLCDGTMCDKLSDEMRIDYEYPEQFPQTYSGVRFTADAMDCSLPISIDSHSGCSYNCLYCFSNNLQRAPDRNPAVLQRAIATGSFYSEWPIRRLEAFLARDLKDKISLAMYPLLDQGCPVQLGALGDPFDELERHSGWAKKALPLFIKYKVPVRVSTKGAEVLKSPEYLKIIDKSPEQFWFAFSIISNSDELIRQVDLKAPVTSVRIEAMKAVTDLGCPASLRFRPFIPGMSDAYPGEPEAWKVLMERAAGAGAGAISFEYIFLNPALTPRQEVMQRAMLKAIGDPHFATRWHGMSKGSETCRRGSRYVKYEQTKKVRDLAHKLGWTFGISDPHFKEWNDTGSCCGLPDSGDGWFTNWSRRQMTEVIVQAHKAEARGEEFLVTYDDWKPEWAHKVGLTSMVNVGNWHSARRKKYVTFGDHMRKKWNDPKHPRSPFQYFDKVMIPVGIDTKTGDLIYTYKNWEDSKDALLPNE